MSDSQLTKIPGIGPSTARILSENGYTSVEAIAKAASRNLAKVQGFGTVRAVVVITAAQSLVSAEGAPESATSPKKVKKTKDRKKKRKKDKKGKGKKKDKKGKKKDGKRKRKK